MPTWVDVWTRSTNPGHGYDGSGHGVQEDGVSNPGCGTILYLVYSRRSFSSN